MSTRTKERVDFLSDLIENKGNSRMQAARALVEKEKGALSMSSARAIVYVLFSGPEYDKRSKTSKSNEKTTKTAAKKKTSSRSSNTKAKTTTTKDIKTEKQAVKANTKETKTKPRGTGKKTLTKVKQQREEQKKIEDSPKMIF